MSSLTYFSSAFRLGIVGGGQLGKMLLAESRRMDIATHVLDPSPSAPAQYGAHHFEQASLTDYQSVYAFGQKCDLLTIEIENINVEALAQLEREGKKVYPQPAVIKRLQSKLSQKAFFAEKGLPSAPYRGFASREALLKAWEDGEISLPAVWKLDRGGFDGRGVQVLRRAEDLEGLPEGACLVEDLVPFEKELAVVVARSASGEMRSFPTVEMDFHPEANLVEYVFSPGLVTPAQSDAAQQLARQCVEALGLVGVLAVEMFLSPQGSLLINEVAPRVHNSGHLSIEGNQCSQFEQHLRAILDLPLGHTDTVQPSVMVNLVGEPDQKGPVFYQGMADILALPGVHLHLYGKAETRPFRKMGHVTITAADLEQARAIAKQVKNQVKVMAL